MKYKKIAIGIDFGGTNIRGALVNELGQTTKVIKIPTERDKGYQKIKSNIVFLINSLLKQNKIDRKKITGIGIGCPGLINSVKGEVLKSPNLPALDSKKFVSDISNEVNIPVIIENDANSIAWGEYCCGIGKNTQSLICVTIGTGIGSGIILNGNIWRGFSGVAGEIGHIIIKDNGLKCGCGASGCLEQYASATALTNEAYKAIKKGKKTSLTLENLSAYEVCLAARSGDALAIEILNKVIHYLSIGIAGLVNVFNPEMIIFGGGVSEAGDFFINPMKDNIFKSAYVSKTYKLKIKRSLLGDKAGIIGAGLLLLNKEK